MEKEELKKKYVALAGKYDLPDYAEINQAFEIEKIDTDSDILLKVIRKIVVEKIVHSLSFVEMLLNPINTSQMYYSYIKSMDEEDKKFLDETYKSFFEISTDSLLREIDYSEKGEAEIIKKVCKAWNERKKGFKRVLSNINNPKVGEKKERSYFG